MADVGDPVAALAELVATLRSEDGCPWDREQTHHTLTRHLIEEAYEVLEALVALPADAPGGELDAAAYEHLKEELGDLLFQVVFHCELAGEAGAFGLADVARDVHEKLVGRHPHVFGAVEVDGAEAVARNWELIKADEKGRASAMDDIPAGLPALLYANKMQRRAAAVGFDWPEITGVFEKMSEELHELEDAAAGAAALPDARIEEELGDVLFSIANLARHLKVDGEGALRAASAKFARRFRVVEALAAERGVDLGELDLAGLDALWDEAKGAESASAS